MHKKKNSVLVNLVEESHKSIGEIAEVRSMFNNGRIGKDQASAYIGLFNASARVMNTAIQAERWTDQKNDKSGRKSKSGKKA